MGQWQGVSKNLKISRTSFKCGPRWKLWFNGRGGAITIAFTIHAFTVAAFYCMSPPSPPPSIIEAAVEKAAGFEMEHGTDPQRWTMFRTEV